MNTCQPTNGTLLLLSDSEMQSIAKRKSNITVFILMDLTTAASVIITSRPVDNEAKFIISYPIPSLALIRSIQIQI